MNRETIIQMARDAGWEATAELWYPFLERFAAAIRAATKEEDARICDQYPIRDPAEDGNGYWAANECAAAIRASK